MSDEQLSMLIDAIVTALVALIPIILAIATRSASRYLKAKEAELAKQGRLSDIKLLKSTANLAIMAAEQLYMPDQQRAKQRYVQEKIWRESKAIGLPLSEDQVNLLLEGTLKTLKQEWPELKATLAE
jgi:hypothetical protein